MANSIKKTAEQLLASMNQESDQRRDELLSIISTHSLMAAGTGLIPIPLADLAASTINIWHMYISINKFLGISFKENMTRSIASAAIANISGNIIGSGLAGLLKVVPGANLAATIVVAATDYAVCTSAGWIYLHALTSLVKSNVDLDNEDDAKRILVREIKDNKKQQNEVARQTKTEYIEDHKKH